MAVPDGFRRVRALSARTHFVPGVGQVHFDPENSKFETRNPALPEDQIEVLVGRGWVADDLDEADVTAAADAPPVLPKAARGGRPAKAGKAAVKNKPAAAPTSSPPSPDGTGPNGDANTNESSDEAPTS
ncbi:hypothetical protein [Novosphingobium sp.]|mgnify:CR=1 FL=1|uniref:hypothetical protein n=1 Tax=Novosphingobium sp. TaxID=1874826 RepID=UPI002FDC9628